MENINKDKIELVKKRLEETSASLVVLNKNDEIKEFYNRRVIDIVSLIKSGNNELDGAIIADKVIGKVAATLLTLSGVKEIFAKTISEYAIEVLEENNISYTFENKVPYIINNDKTGMCPMENKFKDEKNLKVIYNFFVNKEEDRK